MRRILVTGSRGFVGGHLVARLERDGLPLALADRFAATKSGSNIRCHAIGEIGPATDWRPSLDGCDAVVHLAGQTSSAGGPDVCRTVNELGTERLVRQAAEAGVSTFIFASSIMALVDNRADGVVSDRTPSTATSAYGVSKLRAEDHVAAFAREASRVGISLRPPMVYGPGAGGNWRRLQRLAATGLPLPFGSVRNRRSMISVGNLVDAIAHSLAISGRAPSGAYVVADGESLGLAEIVRVLRASQGRAARLLPVPPVLMTAPMTAAGLGQMSASLFGDLEVDASGFRSAFGWSPPEPARDAIAGAMRA